LFEEFDAGEQLQVEFDADAAGPAGADTHTELAAQSE
jgi:hypothetical protein